MTTAETITRKYTITKSNGYFILTGRRGATYIATQAYIGDEDTMKLIGGKWGTQELRDQSGRLLTISRHALAEWAVSA